MRKCERIEELKAGMRVRLESCDITGHGPHEGALTERIISYGVWEIDTGCCVTFLDVVHGNVTILDDAPEEQPVPVVGSRWRMRGWSYRPEYRMTIDAVSEETVGFTYDDGLKGARPLKHFHVEFEPLVDHPKQPAMPAVGSRWKGRGIVDPEPRHLLTVIAPTEKDIDDGLVRFRADDGFEGAARLGLFLERAEELVNQPEQPSPPAPSPAVTWSEHVEQERQIAALMQQHDAGRVLRPKPVEFYAPWERMNGERAGLATWRRR